MTKTTNYHLPQWEETDRIQMDDFNDAMASIDAGVKANADAIAAKTTLTELRRFTVPDRISGGSAFSMDVQDIDWGSWQYVIADFTIQGYGSAKLYPNNDVNGSRTFFPTSNTSGSIAGSLGNGNDNVIDRVIFDIYGYADKHVMCHTRSNYGESSNVNFSELTTLNLQPDNNSYFINAGTTIVFYGVK